MDSLDTGEVSQASDRRGRRIVSRSCSPMEVHDSARVGNAAENRKSGRSTTQTGKSLQKTEKYIVTDGRTNEQTKINQRETLLRQACMVRKRRRPRKEAYKHAIASSPTGCSSSPTGCSFQYRSQTKKLVITGRQTMLAENHSDCSVLTR